MVVVSSRGGGTGGKVKAKIKPVSSTAKIKAKPKDKVKGTTTTENNGKQLEKKAKRKNSSTSNKSCNNNKPLGKKGQDDALTKKVKAVKSQGVNVKGSDASPNCKVKEKGKDKSVPKSQSSSTSTSTSVTSANNVSIASSSTVNSNKKIPAQMQQAIFNSKVIRPEDMAHLNAANGPRIQAQRKFAQAGNICIGTGTMQFHSIPNNSPYATPSKETPLKRSHEGANGSVSSTKKVKKPMFSPPPCKRPKTEDFLTFLCCRGTPTLPPELDMFRYPQVLETETLVLPKKKIFSQSSVQTTNVIEVKESFVEELNHGDNQSQPNSKMNGKNKAVSKLKPQNKLVKNLQPNRKSLSSISSFSISSTSVCKAENPESGIRATASSVLFSKLRKTSPVTRTRPIISPPRSRLNEEDARFAMTALKLKYQRLAVNKSNRSAILTKKAKESIILTRSKSRTSFSPLSPKKGKLLNRTLKPVVISPSRNAPSPDIIFGVTSSTSAARKRAVRSSEESESEDDEKNESSNEESDSACEEETEKKNNILHKEPLIRSLRSGKELTRPKSKSPRPEKKNAIKKNDKRIAFESRRVVRVGTRSQNRMTKSPLREIPMYKPKKLTRKLLKKNYKDVKNKFEIGKDKVKGKKIIERDKKDSKGQPSKKAEKLNDDGKRPSRKTKETATNLLGFLNHGFSTDDQDSEDERRNAKNEDSEVGSSSSSEAHYLEKHYNAAMRREEEKFMKNKKTKSDMQRRHTRRHSSNSFTKFEKKVEDERPGRKLRSKRSTSDDEKPERKPERKFKKKELDNKKSSTLTKPKTRQGTPALGDGKMQGAARKSASIVCGRRRSQYSSSESEDSSAGSASEDDKKSSDESENSELEAVQTKAKMTVKEKQSSKKQVRVKRSKFKKSDYSDDADEQSDNDSENGEILKESEHREDDSEPVDSDEELREIKPSVKKENGSNVVHKKGKVKEIKPMKEIKRERSLSISSNRSGSASHFEREESVETEQCKLSPRSRLSRSRSRSGSHTKSNRSKEEESPSSDEEGDGVAADGHRNASSASEDDEEEELEAEPEKADACTQVDMDEEEGIPTISLSLAEQAGLVPKREPLPLPPPPPPKDDSDDEVQEIGQVFASSSNSTSIPRHLSSRRIETASPTSGHSARTLGTPSSLSASVPLFHHQHPTPPLQQQPPQFHHSSTPTIDPIQHNPFNPFMPPPPRPQIQPDFYTPLQLGPPMVHSSIQLVGSSLGMGTPMPSFPVGNPLNTLSIPVSVPFSSHLLPQHHPSTLGFATGSTFHATTLQTHIRSVATNLDIPLVRPMVGVGGDLHHSSINFMGRGPSIGLSSNTPLTRPPSMAGLGGLGFGGVWSQQQMDPNSASTTSRNHYSAFRVPHLNSATATHTTHTTQHVIHHQSTTVLGMNTPVLPVSIIQPQTHHHHPHSQHQPNQHNVQSQQSSNHYSQHYQPNKSKSKGGSNVKQKQSAPSTSSSSVPSTSSPATTSQRPKSPTPPGYHLIKHLPNVSIVPKFDRTSHQEAGSSSKKETKNGTNNEKKEPGEKKKVGRKKKESVVLPHPSSPLTVRKDSNPSTYAPKKQSKTDGDSEKESSTCNLMEDSLTTTSSQQSSSALASTTAIKSPQKQSVKDEFGVLLKKKETSKNCPSPAPSSSSTTSSCNPKRDKSQSPKTSKTKKDRDTESCSSSKSQSNPPSRTSSPNVQSKCKSGGKAVEDGPQSNTSGIADAPTYHPSDQEFEDPLKYIQKIQPQAEKYGMARIVPPKSFRPECNVEDDMRFTAYNHYIHKMYQRWGPNVMQSEAIKHNLKQSQVDVSEIPVIGGMEINLSTLYETVKSCGGLKEVIEKQRWTKAADAMHVPKAAHDRAAKLDAIYLKYVLPYDILSDAEREKLKKKVEKKWTKRRETILKAAENCEDEDLDEDSMDELDECIVKGKTTPLSSYYRVARNTLNIFFPPEKGHSCNEIEEEYWKIVRERNQPVCVYSGSIDCAGVGWGFPIPKSSNKHPWNLKVLANNQGSVLRSIGPVMGATVPTLHVAMLFTSYCWYRDPHSLPWVEYLHSGANKIWYSVAAAHENSFRSALTELMPMQCKKKQIWLASDSAMVPPEMLVAKGVPLVRAVQNPGEFLVVFPKAYTSAICTGYLISESVCFAYPSWLQTCIQTFKDIHDSKEPPVFPLEKLLLSILQDARASLEVVRSILPATKQLIKEEITLRKKITSLGVKLGGKISKDSESDTTKNSTKKKKSSREEEIEQCYNCNYTLYLSMVRNLKTDVVMCLKHALEHFAKHKADIKKSNVLFDLEQSVLETILENASKRCGNVMPRSPDK